MITVGEAVYLTFKEKVGTVEKILLTYRQRENGSDLLPSEGGCVRYLVSWPCWYGRKRKWFDSEHVEWDEKGMREYCPDREECGWTQSFPGVEKKRREKK